MSPPVTEMTMVWIFQPPVFGQEIPDRAGISVKVIYPDVLTLPVENTPQKTRLRIGHIHDNKCVTLSFTFWYELQDLVQQFGERTYRVCNRPSLLPMIIRFRYATRVPHRQGLSILIHRFRTRWRKSNCLCSYRSARQLQVSIVPWYVHVSKVPWWQYLCVILQAPRVCIVLQRRVCVMLFLQPTDTVLPSKVESTPLTTTL